MEEMFRLKIAAKRQVTLPQRLLNALQIGEGDEIRLQVTDGQIASADACKAVPTRLFSREVLEELAVREREMAQGRSIPIASSGEAVEMGSSAVAMEVEAAEATEPEYGGIQMRGYATYENS